MKENEEKREYEDIIHLPHHVSDRFPHMSARDRAAQFAPFKSLVGLEDEIAETTRRTDEKRELSEEKQREIDSALHSIRDRTKETFVRAVYFRPDEKKAGGGYVSLTGRVKRIDEAKRLLVFSDGRTIRLEDLYELQFPEN